MHTIDKEMVYGESGRRLEEIDRWKEISDLELPIIGVKKGETKMVSSDGRKVLWFRAYVLCEDGFEKGQSEWHRHYPSTRTYQVGFSHIPHDDKDWELVSTYVKVDYRTQTNSMQILYDYKGFRGDVAYLDKTMYAKLGWSEYHEALGPNSKQAIAHNMRDFSKSW
jgi:hypothetical protein